MSDVKKERLPFDPENDFFQASSSCQIRNPDLNLPPEDSSGGTLESSSPPAPGVGHENLDHFINVFKKAETDPGQASL